MDYSIKQVRKLFQNQIGPQLSHNHLQLSHNQVRDIFLKISDEKYRYSHLIHNIFADSEKCKSFFNREKVCKSEDFTSYSD